MLEHKNHKPRKRFGQNFLLDQTIISQILTAVAPQPTDHLLEIGPGMGAITAQLLPVVKHLAAVELDRDLFAFLKQKFAACANLSLYNADILDFDLTFSQNEISSKNINYAHETSNHVIANNSAHEYNGNKIRVVGNIPYNISTPLIFHLLDSYAHAPDVLPATTANMSKVSQLPINTNVLGDIHLMVQKEVALRLASKHGSKNFGRLSIMVQSCCRVEYLFDIPPTAFEPKPAVDSAFIRLIPDLTLADRIKDKVLLNTLVTAAFNQRRKTIYNALKSFQQPHSSNGEYPSSASSESRQQHKTAKQQFSTSDIRTYASSAMNITNPRHQLKNDGHIGVSTEILTSAGINPTLRPEQISVAEYITLSNILAE